MGKKGTGGWEKEKGEEGEGPEGAQKPAMPPGATNPRAATDRRCFPCEDVDAPETPLPSGEQFFLDGNFLPTSFLQESFVQCRDVIEYVCPHDGTRPPPNKTTTILRSLVDYMLRSQLETLHDLVLRFDMHELDQLEMLNSLETMMFDDQVVTWGRIVTLCAFCGYLPCYCREQCLPPDYGDIIADVLICIVVNGSVYGSSPISVGLVLFAIS